jgi:hypothetical protein
VAFPCNTRPPCTGRYDQHQSEVCFTSHCGAENAAPMADANSPRLEGRTQAGNAGSFGPWVQQFIERCPDGDRPGWGVEPDVGRVANGVSDRSHRLKGLGNAVVPQIPELIGRAILAAMSRAADHSRSGCDDCAAAIPQTAAAPFSDPTGDRNV